MSSFHVSLLALALVCAAGCDDPSSLDDGAGGSGTSGDPTSTSSASSSQGGGDATGEGGSATTGAGAGEASTGTMTAASAGSGGSPPDDPCPSFASELVEVAYGPGAGFGQDDPSVIFGAPRGGGCCEGSLDVLALGNGGSITVGFHETRVVDGEGADFIVFENPFFAGGDEASPFVELGTVEVSADGETWHGFDCASLDAPWDACAGVTPVYANADENETDPLDPAAAGGDAYDLAHVGLAEARYVRIVDRVDQTGFGGTFDLDAIGVVHGRCDADAP